MADVLIRGIKMPEYCHECPCQNEESGYCQAYESGYLYSIERPAKCPLVPLPEGHGDLIERKALNLFPDYKEVRNRIKQTIKATERDGRNITGVTIDLLKQTLVALDSFRSVRRYFLNAKTIVPAEGDKENG